MKESVLLMNGNEKIESLQLNIYNIQDIIRALPVCEKPRKWNLFPR